MIRTLLVLALVSACSKKSEPSDKPTSPSGDPPAVAAPTNPAGSGSAAPPPASPPPASPPTGGSAEATTRPGNCVVPATFAPIESEGADVFLIAAGKDSTAPKGGTTATLRLPNPNHLSRAYLRLVGKPEVGTIELRPVEGDASCKADGCANVEFMIEGATERAESVAGQIVLEEVTESRVIGHIVKVKVVEPRDPKCAMVIEKLSFDLDLGRALTY